VGNAQRRNVTRADARSARERLAAQQAAARRAESRRRATIAVASVVIVIAAVIGIFIARSVTKPSTPAAPPAAAPMSDAALARDIATVPASALNAVGAGPGGAGRVTPLIALHGAPMKVAGKPDVLFIGAEYCPFCAAERWAITVALSRFGTFSGLHFIRSSSTDVYSNTSTLSFYRSSYTSKYLTFSPVELETVTGATLQTPTSAQQAALDTYDVTPYVSQAGAIPFVDLDNKYLISGSQYPPSVLGSTPAEDPAHYGLSWSQIATDLHDPSSPVAQSVLGAANNITAGLCRLTNGQPGGVCQSTAVLAIGKPIPASSSTSGSSTAIELAIAGLAVVLLAGLGLLAWRRSAGNAR